MTGGAEFAEDIVTKFGEALALRDAALVRLLERVERMEASVAAIPAGKDGRDGLDGSPGSKGEVGAPGSRGESGERGPDGRDGRDGKDGKDGIASRDEVRAEAAKAVDELRAEVLVEVKKAAAEEVAALPTMQYKGVWKEHAEYRHGDCVSWGGSTWHAMADTNVKPGGGGTAWVLMAKAGQAGRNADWRDGQKK